MPQVARTTHGGMADPARPQEEKASATIAEHGWLGEAVSHSMDKQIVGKFDASDAALEIAKVRSAVTAILHRDVEILGRQVLGDRY
ncbi:hypothetical protein A0H81_07084 [Grifola frondosa]|uniref:Uncharacterized protein n=1 Tax=Grifola frondosa TaxID=5627 RepID=A0A1C7M983_GRIFR|nr:hypothetical protein A0H81_07084 [Grifola frondosa]